MKYPLSLSVSCVTYNSHELTLINTLDSLVSACAHARMNGLLAFVSLTLIDNGPDEKNLSLTVLLAERYATYFDGVNIKTGQGNIGYGCGHNLAIHEVATDYHLVLNPDVVIDSASLSIALAYMNENPHVGLLVPDASDSDGGRQYIAKRQPSFMVLLARALNNPWLNKLFKKQLNHYEYRDLIPASEPLQIELASGCFMFLRTQALQAIGGFDKRFFMYFEDFELSQRLAKKYSIVHHPQVQIMHLGGNASRKGLKHLAYFFYSYLVFFAIR